MLSFFSRLTDSFSSGAPLSSCSDLTPRHGFSPQTGDPPVQIVMDKHVINSDSYLRVTLRSRRTFKGFLLFAESHDTRYLGTWYIPYLTHVSHVSESRYLHCEARVQSAVTQSGQARDMWLVSFQWRPPDNFSGWSVFRATIVESYEVFWTDIVSNKVWVVSDNDTDDNEVENEKSISDKKTSYYNYKLGDGDYDLDVDNRFRADFSR